MNEPAVARPTPTKQDVSTLQLPVVWYEFLLNPSLLEEHLAKETAEPSPVQLIGIFLEHALAQAPPSNLWQPTESTAQGNAASAPGGQNNAQIVSNNTTEKKRTKMLKSLALQTAAHLNWNLTIIQSSLPIHLAHSLLTDFLRHTHTPVDSPVESLDFSTMDDNRAIALITYHRWCIRLVVLEGFPVKPTKPSALQGVPDIAQVQPNVKENILKTVSDSIDKSVAVLEHLLTVERDVKLPTPQTIRKLADLSDQSASASDTAAQDSPVSMFESTQSCVVKAVELHCQVAYDLGAVHFSYLRFQEAADKFALVSELLPKVGTPMYCFIDMDKYAGYCAACRSLRDISITMATPSLHQRMEQSRRNNYEGMVDLLVEDNEIKETPMAFRNTLETELQKDESNSDLHFQVCTCNAVRLLKNGHPVSPEYKASLRDASHEQWNLLFQICMKCTVKSTKQEQANVKVFLRELCLTHKSWHLLCASEAKQMFSAEEIVKIEEELNRIDVLNSSVSVENQTTGGSAENRSVLIGQLEQKLIQSNNPDQILALLTELCKLAPGKRYSSISDKWQVSKSYNFVIEGMGNSKTQDLVFLTLVKAKHCRNIKSYSMAKKLLEKAHETVKDHSFKLAKAISQEILYVEMLSQDLSVVSEDDKANYIKRVINCLTSSTSDIQPEDEIIEQCVAFLLNTKSWSSLLEVKNRSPYADFGKLIASVCKDLPDIKVSRKAARDLWDAMVTVFVNMTHQKRGFVSGKGGVQISRDASSAVLPKLQFVHFLEQLQEPTCLSMLISCLVKMYNIIQDDISTDLSSDYPTLWPTTITNVSAISKDSVAMVTSQTVSHALSVDASQPSWLKTTADIHYSNGEFAAAIKYYIEAAMIVTDFFNQPVPRTVWNEKVYKRIIKCCSNLQCHTQAAILCQFLEQVDYTTAFKELQEKSCYDAMDALYEYIWDVTILEFLVYNHNKHGEVDKKKTAIQCIGRPELNSFNPEEILKQASQSRKNKFLQAMAKQYL
ncbi:integrator complex subunit 8-like [Ptychodera flava]|uniref:integrator complex subunit 8-like n=1 Tax=Ptychodera flava TaxID=63121 RepID=UPI00396A8906